MVDLMLGHNVELVSEFAQDLRGSLDGHNDFSGHSHGDLHRLIGTGPISLS